MAYRVTMKGIQIEADSLDETLALVRQILATEGADIQVVSQELRAWNTESTGALLNAIRSHPQQKRLIELLYHAKEDGLLKEELVAMMEMGDARQLGGILSALSKNATRLGCFPIIEIEDSRTDDGWTSRYKLRSDFVEAVQERARQRNQKISQEPANAP